MQHELHEYPTPSNLNYWWNFGSLAGIMLVIMIVTGIFLAMQYTPHADLAFNSVERIMRDVNYGWLMRYIHMNGASMFFIVTYIHMFRGLYYGSYKEPRELLWMLGVVILLLMMATAFMGYVLPWGQMSYLGRHRHHQPVLGDPGRRAKHRDLAVGRLHRRQPDPEPLLLAALPAALRHPRRGRCCISSRCTSTARTTRSASTRRGRRTRIPFHPYYTIKDMFGLGVFLIIFAIFVFYMPNLLGDPHNYIPANPLQTPPRDRAGMVLPAVLRDPALGAEHPLHPGKLVGVIADVRRRSSSCSCCPGSTRSPVRSARFRPIYKWVFWLLVIDVLRARLCRRAPAGRLVRRHRPDRDALLLLPFPDPVPADRQVRAAAAAADQHQRRGHCKGGGRWPARRADGEAVMRKLALLAAGIAALSLGAAAAAGPGRRRRRRISNGRSTGRSAPSTAPPLQRGFQVYKEVCSRLPPGKLCITATSTGIGYTEDAGQGASPRSKQVTDGPNDQGEMFQRPAGPPTRSPAPFPNEQAARAAQSTARCRPTCR